MEQNRLFHESIYEALRATVAGLGGAKSVAQTLFPEKSLDDATRYLLDCLNPDRSAELKPERLMLLLKMARAKGIHVASRFIGDETGYLVTPIEPEDEMAELQRQFIASVEQNKALADRIERLMGRPQVVAIRK
jgi:hypothetical protein